MMTKTAYYMQMAQEAAAQITGSKEQWTAFLTTSARLYKYPFAEQLMIYKQRPEATACAEYDLWNDRMNRYVKRGSKGIALLDMRGEQPKLRYVFDVADTGERKNSRPVQLWKMNAEHEQPIIRALDAAFDVSAGAGSLENHIMEAAERLARDYWEENRRQISDIVADSYLEGYDELNIGASFKRAAAVSIAYSVFTRTVGNADDYFEHEDFLDIFDTRKKKQRRKIFLSCTAFHHLLFSLFSSPCSCSCSFFCSSSFRISCTIFCATSQSCISDLVLRYSA